MSKFLTTCELANFVKDKYEGVKVSAQRDEIYCELDIYFSNGTPNNVEGTYVYSDEIGYHFVFTERGKISLHKITDDLFEISYWIYADQTFKMSLKYATKHKKNNQDFRRILFEKKLEMLGLVGNNYRKRGEIEVDEILKIAPYNDNLS